MYLHINVTKNILFLCILFNIFILREVHMKFIDGLNYKEHAWYLLYALAIYFRER